jgi:predicted permease
MGCLWQDLRFGIRLLLRNPGFTVIAVTALALGIGANSAVFTVVYNVMLKPLPYREPERLVRVYESNPGAHFPVFPLSPGNFVEYRALNHVFQDFAVFARQDQQFGGEHPERLVGVRISDGFFRALGSEPMLGRAFLPDEETRDGASTTAIISYNAWQRLFGGDRHIIGKSIRLSDSPFTIVGVMPAGFEQIGNGYRLTDGAAVDVWLPFNLLANPQRARRDTHYCNAVARLKPGIIRDAAEAEMNVIAAGLERQYAEDQGWRIRLMPLHDDVTGKGRPLLLLLAGAVGFVLLIACVNVANLLLARAAGREREMAVRTALGASRRRLLVQMFTESLTLSAAGGALGLLLGMWGVRALIALGPAQLPRLRSIEIDFRMFLFSAAVTVLTGLLFGLAPAWQVTRSSLNLSLKSRHGVSGALVVAEVALAFVLLTGAGLLLRSFVAILRVEPGFETRQVLTLNTSLSYPKLVGARRYAAFYQRFLESLATLPGVAAVGASSTLPWTGANDNSVFEIEGRPPVPNMGRHAYYQFISPDYLRSIGVPLLAGRQLTKADHFDAPKVMLVNRTMALEYWPNLEACLGRRIQAFGDFVTIVGVVGDVKDGPTEARPQPAFYIPFLQNPSFGTYITLRTTADAAILIPAVRRAAEQAGNDLSIQEIRPMEQLVAAAVSGQRFALQLVGLFAAMALLLALIGIYGVMSQAAGRRRREIAIRMALGANRGDTLGLLLRQGLALIGAGVIAGAVGARALTSVLGGLLYQVTPADPLTFGAAALVVTLVATGAILVPARRAMKVDAMQVLRQE